VFGLLCKARADLAGAAFMCAGSANFATRLKTRTQASGVASVSGTLPIPALELPPPPERAAHLTHPWLGA